MVQKKRRHQQRMDENHRGHLAISRRHTAFFWALCRRLCGVDASGCRTLVLLQEVEAGRLLLLQQQFLALLRRRHFPSLPSSPRRRPWLEGRRPRPQRLSLPGPPQRPLHVPRSCPALPRAGTGAVACAAAGGQQRRQRPPEPLRRRTRQAALQAPPTIRPRILRARPSRRTQRIGGAWISALGRRSPSAPPAAKLDRLLGLSNAGRFQEEIFTTDCLA